METSREETIKMLEKVNSTKRYSPEYIEWENFIAGVYRKAKAARNNTIMVIIGDTQRNMNINSIEASKVADFIHSKGVIRDTQRSSSRF